MRTKVARIWVANRHPFLLLFFPLHIQIHTSTHKHTLRTYICIASIHTSVHTHVHQSTSIWSARKHIHRAAQHPNTTYTHSLADSLSPSLLLGVLGGKYLARQSQAIIIFYSEHHRCRLFHCCCCCCRYRYYHRRSRRPFSVSQTYHATAESEWASERENKGVYLNILNFCITKRGCEFV